MVVKVGDVSYMPFCLLKVESHFSDMFPGCVFLLTCLTVYGYLCLNKVL